MIYLLKVQISIQCIKWLSYIQYFLLPFLHRGQPFVSTKVQPVFDWTQTPHMFWTVRQVLTAEHDQLASKHFPKIVSIQKFHQC